MASVLECVAVKDWRKKRELDVRRRRKGLERPRN